MSDAPSPQRASSAEERDRLQLEAEERARGWLEAYNLPLNDGAHPMLPTLTRELVSFGRHALAPLLDRITAAEARAEASAYMAINLRLLTNSGQHLNILLDASVRIIALCFGYERWLNQSRIR